MKKRKQAIQKMIDGGAVAMGGVNRGAQLAGAGAAFGPWGAAIGGVAGLGLGVTESIMGQNAEEAAAKAAEEQAAKQKTYNNSLAAYMSRPAGYKDGGKIKGKKGIDKQPMKADGGGFIVPRENAQEAMKIGKKYLGWKNGETASKSTGDTNLKVTDGEVYFTPEEYDMLVGKGINVDALAPNAESTLQKKCGGAIKKMINGGGVPDVPFKVDRITKRMFTVDPITGEKIFVPNELSFDDTKKGNYVQDFNKDIQGKKMSSSSPFDSDLQAEQQLKELSTIRNKSIDNPIDPNADAHKTYMDATTKDNQKQADEINATSSGNKMQNAAMIAGGVQAAAGIAGGIYQIHQANKKMKELAKNKPIDTVAPELLAKLTNAKEAASYGYDQYTMQDAAQELDVNTAEQLAGTTNTAARSAIMSGKYRNFLKTMSGDKQFQEQKRGALMGVQSEIAGAQDRIKAREIADWNKLDEAAGDVKLVGFHNIDGAANYAMNLGRDYQRMKMYEKLFA